MELAVFASDLRRLDRARECDRIYFGNEFCQTLLPSAADLDEALESCSARGLPLSLVTPYVTDEGLERLVPLLDRLPAGGEVVVNDWGVLAMVGARYRSLRPVLGRLQSRQTRDPRLLRLIETAKEPVHCRTGESVVVRKYIPDPMMRHFRSSCIGAPSYQSCLAEFGVRRFEIDNLLHGIHVEAGPAMSVSVYVPFGYVTTTRACPGMSAHRGRLAGVPGCDRDCRRRVSEMRNDGMPATLYQQGNTIFYRNDDWSADRFAALGVDRIVLQPSIPM